MRLLTLIFYTFFLLGSAIFGQEGNLAPSPDKPESYIVNATIKKAQAYETSALIHLDVELKMPKGWHIYANEHVSLGLPTTLTWTSSQGDLMVVNSEWPAPEAFEFGGLESQGFKESVFVSFTLKSNTPIQLPLQLEGTLSYLACLDVCIPETQTIPVTISTFSAPSVTAPEMPAQAEEAVPAPKASVQSKDVVPAPKALVQTEEAVPAPKTPLQVEKSVPAPTTPVQVASDSNQGSAPIILLAFAFLGGLILNAMPCVFPVLSIKLFSILKHKDDRAALARESAWFVLGVLTVFWIFSGLILAFRAASETVGWGFHLQSPYTIFVLIIVFFLMSLNFFGLFEVGLSLTRVQGSSQRSSKATSFLNGALTTIVATPCTAPFMGTALGATLTTGPLLTILIFTSLGLGLSFPFILLPIFPKFHAYLPKPGAWMETLKQFFGFPLLITAIWLISVLINQTYPSIWFPTSLSLVGLGMTGWLYGLWQKKPSVTTLIITLIVGVLSLGYGASSLKEKTSSIDWVPFSPALIQELENKKQPYFVDVTADWCITCKVNERLFDSPDIRSAILNKKITMIKADWTNRDQTITAYLESYQRNGVPLYVYKSKESYKKPETAPKILPQILTKGGLLDTF